MVASKSLALVIVALSVSCADASWGTWTGPFNTDIDGTGMGGSYAWGLSACKSRCTSNSQCQAAQYSWYAKYNGFNCFIYNNQGDYSAALAGFKLYKFTRNGGGGGGGNGAWTPAIYKDICGTGIGGGSYQWSLSNCKNKCTSSSSCKAAQYSNNQKYNGYNCFIYNNQNANCPQLGNFKLYYYKGNARTWGGPIYGDINGVGMGGTREWNLNACKHRCARNLPCQAAQYCNNCYYPVNGRNYNCFIYDNQYVNNPQLKQFILYKFNRGGCGHYGCCPNGVTPKTSSWDPCWWNKRLFATEDGKDGKDGSWDDEATTGSIMNLALPASLSIGAVLAVVGVVRFTRARLSRRVIAVPVEEGVEDGLVEEETEIHE